MMAMVVLWPKMKAPQRRVTAPQTVRMTLEGTRWSVTPGVNAARISEIIPLVHLMAQAFGKLFIHSHLFIVLHLFINTKMAEALI